MTSITLAPFHFCADLSELPVPASAEDREVSEAEYQGFRNGVLQALRPFGSVGPMGEFPLTLPASERDRAWPVENAEPVYFVPDDQLNSHTLYLLVEVESSASITLPVLEALWALMQTWRLCGVGVNVASMRYFYIRVDGVWFSDREGAYAGSVLEAVTLPPVTTRPAA